MVTKADGTVKARYDYLPFGEELGAGIGQRTVGMGYGGADSTRQKFTSKERDSESGLDYFLAKYYSSAQGRFLSPDPYNVILAKQMSKNFEAAESSFVDYLSVTQQWNRYSYATNNPLKYIDPNGEKIEIFGNEEERKKALQRIKDTVGADAGKLLYVKEENGHYYVDYDHSKAGGLAKFSELAAHFETMIDSEKTVEFHIATTFQFKYNEWWGLSKGVRTRSVTVYGGAATLSPEESLSGNTEIYVHPNAGAVTQEIFGNTFLSTTRSNNGKPLDFYNDIVDAHEFGHAYGMIKGYRGDDTNAYAHRLENYVRERRKLPNRRVRE